MEESNEDNFWQRYGPRHFSYIHIVLLVVIILGLVLLGTQKYWVPSLVKEILKHEKPQSKTVPLNTLVSFSCGNGTNFKAEQLNSKQLEVITASGTIKQLPLQIASGTAQIYGDEHYGYTFIGQFGSDMVLTDRAGRTSVICMAGK